MAFLEQILPPPVQNPQILIPGIAQSELGALLLDRGYEHVFVCDLGPDEVSEDNKRLFGKSIRYFDLLDEMPEDWVGSFDFVIDSSVTDVFIQMTTQVKKLSMTTPSRVHGKFLSFLKPDSKMVVFSMNLQPWKRIYQGKQMNKKHAIVTPRLENVSSYGRRTTMPQQDMHVLVASQERLDSLPNVTLDNQRYATRISGWFDSIDHDELDWTSERS